MSCASVTFRLSCHRRAFTSELGFSLANGSTPLHIAAELNRTEEAKAILRHHASHSSRNIRVSVDIRWVRDSDGWTPYQVWTSNRII